MANANAESDFPLVTPEETVRLARDRQRGIQVQRLQLKIAEAAGDQVDQAEKDRLKKADEDLGKIATDAEGNS